MELKLRNGPVTFDGKSYLLGFALPNFYFHVTTAYDLLRLQGRADRQAGLPRRGTLSAGVSREISPDRVPLRREARVGQPLAPVQRGDLGHLASRQGEPRRGEIALRLARFEVDDGITA